MVPCESTIRRTLQRLDADAFDDRIGAWAQRRTTPPTGGRRLVTVDGKTLRGSASGAGPGRAPAHDPHDHMINDFAGALPPFWRELT